MFSRFAPPECGYEAGPRRPEVFSRGTNAQHHGSICGKLGLPRVEGTPRGDCQNCVSGVQSPVAGLGVDRTDRR